MFSWNFPEHRLGSVNRETRSNWGTAGRICFLSRNKRRAHRPWTAFFLAPRGVLRQKEANQSRVTRRRRKKNRKSQKQPEKGLTWAGGGGSKLSPPSSNALPFKPKRANARCVIDNASSAQNVTRSRRRDEASRTLEPVRGGGDRGAADRAPVEVHGLFVGHRGAEARGGEIGGVQLHQGHTLGRSRRQR